MRDADHGEPRQPRRVVMFDAYPHVYGGAQRAVHQIAGELAARGLRVILVTTAEGPLPDRFREDGLAVDVVVPPRGLARYGRTTVGWAAVFALLMLPWWWLRAVRALRRHRPDVVHVSDHRGLVLAGIPVRVARSRLVWHIQGMEPNRVLNTLGSRLAHRIVVPTVAVVAKMPGLDHARGIRAIPYPYSGALTELPVTPLTADPRVVTSTRLHPDKGLDVLVDAAASLLAELPDLHITIMGAPQEGSEQLPDELRARATVAGLGDRLHLPGFVREPEAELRQARCYVQASRERTEILPIAILEAMAVGTPVVATDVGGVADLVRDGGTGLLVPPEDTAALATAIRRVLTDDTLAERVRLSARAMMESPRYRPAQFVDDVVDVYCEAMTAR